MKLLKPGPYMWPKEYRNERISGAFYCAEWNIFELGMSYYRRTKRSGVVVKLCTWVSRWLAHFGFRFREDRDEMVWYIEEERWREAIEGGYLDLEPPLREV